VVWFGLGFPIFFFFFFLTQKFFLLFFTLFSFIRAFACSIQALQFQGKAMVEEEREGVIVILMMYVPK